MPIDFAPYHAVLLDLDGTLCHEDHALPGAVQVVTRLQAEGKPFAILTNSNDSPIRVMERMERMGLDVEPDVIYTAAAAACDFVLEHFGKPEGRKPRAFNLSTESVHDMLDGIVDWVTHIEQPCDAMLCGAISNTYAEPEERRRAALILARNGAAIVGGCADRVYISPRGIEYGSGALTWMLAYAANAQPIFCGKPEKIFFEELCQRIQVPPHMCLLIGDNLEADIVGGKAVGMRTILSLSGVTRASDAQNLDANHQPDLIVNDLTEVA